DYNWQSQEGRREIWFRGLGYMLDHPLVGIGINNFERAEGTISDKARRSFAGDPIRWTAPHNSFVQVGAELGFPGLILWSSLIILDLQAGGLERLVADLARRLDPARFENQILALRFLGRNAAGLETVARLHVAGRLPPWTMLWPHPLIRQIRAIAPDVVHTHS